MLLDNLSNIFISSCSSLNREIAFAVDISSKLNIIWVGIIFFLILLLLFWFLVFISIVTSVSWCIPPCLTILSSFIKKWISSLIPPIPICVQPKKIALPLYFKTLAISLLTLLWYSINSLLFLNGTSFGDKPILL